MENYEKLEQLLKSTAYCDLSADDKLAIRQFVSSEEEYEALRQATKQASDYFDDKKVSLDPRIWKRIRASRHALSAPEKIYWINAPMPAYITALLLLGVAIAGWFAGLRYQRAETVVRIQPQIDTVFVVSRPDTIIKERVIYVHSTAPVQVTQTVNKNPASKGVNMKEKEELEKLLVSGSM